jgi:ribosomal protein S18 acetylase RimI-like enzyme
VTYAITIENGHTAHAELDPLYRQHYAEMQTRLAKDGVPIGPYAPRLGEYFKAMDGGWLVTFVVRLDGKVVGYSNVYVTNDMHNGESIAQEDTIYILPEHRNGIGKKLVQFVLDELQLRGVKRGHVTAMTDLRVEKLWKRMGFRTVAASMLYVFR